MADSFTDLDISSPLVRACEDLGHNKPTPVQSACIPVALTGRDICVYGVTGSGKCVAFLLSALERLLCQPQKSSIRVLFLAPTKERAMQVHKILDNLVKYIPAIRCCLVTGGLSMKVQESVLRTSPDIVIATPGRMIDHLYNSKSIHLEELAILILDEADRLLELGFSDEIHELVMQCPKKRQTMLFSKTMNERVDELIRLFLDRPWHLSDDPSTLTEE